MTGNMLKARGASPACHAGGFHSHIAASRGTRRTKGGPVVDDQAGFAVFLSAYLPRLHRYGTALTGNPHDGADLVQHACEKAGVRWARVAAHEDPLAYVMKIMSNDRISSWRSRRRESLVADIPETSFAAEPAVTDPIWSAVRNLPPRQRAIIVLRYVEDRSETDIAAILGIAAGTVKSQAAKAMATLRRNADQTISGGTR